MSIPAIEYDRYGYAHQIKDGQTYLTDQNRKKWKVATAIGAIENDTDAIDLRNQEVTEFPEELFDFPQLKVIMIKCAEDLIGMDSIKVFTQLETLFLQSNKSIYLKPVFCDLQTLTTLILQSKTHIVLPPEIQQLKKMVTVPIEIYVPSATYHI